MSPWNTRTIRAVLGHGSGFDSPRFRYIRRVSPSLGEAFNALRHEQNLSLVELYVAVASSRSCTNSQKR